jgi:hypothetical protein
MFYFLLFDEELIAALFSCNHFNSNAYMVVVYG